MHVPPEIWGPMFWGTFHIISLAYPDEPNYSEKRAAKEFFNSMAFLLPCPICRDHYAEILKVIPVDTWLDNRASLIEWVVMVHNKVNEKLGKRTITQEEFYKRYREMADRGLPIPPSGPVAEEVKIAGSEQYIRGATHTAIAIFVTAAVGGLLWSSYSKK